VASFLWMLDDMVINLSILVCFKRALLIFLIGKTSSTDATDSDLSIDVLVADFCEMIKVLFPDPSKCPTFLVKNDIFIRPLIFVDYFL
jgi:hypothetical protein